MGRRCFGAGGGDHRSQKGKSYESQGTPFGKAISPRPSMNLEEDDLPHGGKEVSRGLALVTSLTPVFLLPFVPIYSLLLLLISLSISFFSS